MERPDHMATASWGKSDEADAFRAREKKAIEDGDFEGAMEMGINDVREKFGDKYDKAIEDMKDYAKKSGIVE